MEKCLIVAIADNRGIGVKGELPWHIAEDLKYFKKVTHGYPVIMGRTTYFSLPFRPESYTLFVYGTCSRCHNRQVKAKKQESKTNKRNIEK